MARFCTSCGAEATPEDRFCGSCGAALRTTRTSPQNDSRPATETDQAGGEPPDRERTGHGGSPARAADAPDDQHRDIFVSYAEKDLTWAEWIGWHLEEATFRVVLQAWDSVAGRNWVADLDDGIQNTDYMVVVASGAYFSSPRTRPQWTAVVAGGTVPIIPVLVEDIQIPGLLATLIPITLAGRDEENARTELLGQMRDVLRGRAKPTDQPPHPGEGLGEGRPPIPARERAVPTKPTYPPILLIAGMSQDSATDETSATPDDSTGSSSPGGDGAAGPDVTSSEPAAVAGNGTSGSMLRSLWNRPHIRAAVGGVVAVAAAGAVAAAIVLPGTGHPPGGGVSVSGHPTATGQPTSGIPARLATLTAPNDTIYSVAFSPDGHILATAGQQDGQQEVFLWNVTDPAQPTRLATFPVQTNTVYAPKVAFSPDGRTLATGTWDHTVILWNVTDPAQPARLATLTDYTGPVLAVAFSPDGRTLATGSWESEDRPVQLWNVADPAQPTRLATLTGQSDQLMSVAFSPDGRTLAYNSGSSLDRNADYTVILWNIADPAQPTRLATLTGFAAGVDSMAFSPDGRTLATGEYGSQNTSLVILWNITDPAQPTRLATLPAFAAGVRSVAFSPDGQILATGSEDDNPLILWNVADPAQPTRLATLTGHTTGVFSVTFSLDGRTLASAGGDDTVSFWRVKESS